MSGPFFIEIISKHGHAKYRQRVESLPVRVGRAYDNDVILDDSAVAPHHLQLEQAEDGGLIVRDLGSENGIVHKGRKMSELAVDGHTIFRIGHSVLRVRSADFEVAPEKKLTASRRLEGWRAALAGLAMIIGLTAISAWVNDSEKFEALRYVAAIAAMLILGLVWCGIWAFATRLYSGTARFGRHLFIMASGLVCMNILELAGGATAYAFSLEAISHYGSHGSMIVIAVMVYGHLVTVNPNLRKAFAVVGVMVALIGSCGLLMINYYRQGHLADERFMAWRFPPSIRISSDKPVSSLIADAKKLKAEIDRDRTKAVAVSEEDEDDAGEE